MKEIRKPIQSPHDRYQISSVGRIRMRTRTPRKTEISNDGRVIVTIRDLSNGGKNTKFTISRLVYTVFNNLPYDVEGCVMHIDGSQRNNKIENLKLTDKSEIALNAIEKGNMKLPHEYGEPMEFDVKDFSGLKLFNLTGHPVNIVQGPTIHPHAFVRLATTSYIEGYIEEVPVYKETYKSDIVPRRNDGRIYIVSHKIAVSFPDRDDFYVPFGFNSIKRECRGIQKNPFYNIKNKNVTNRDLH